MTLEVPLFSQGATYSARLTRQLLANLLDEGILGAASFEVTERGAGANFSVDVALGVCVVTGDDQASQGNYLAVSTATENVVVSAAPGSNSRYDIVVVQINDPTAGGAAGDDFTVEVIAGTADPSPTAPTVPDSALLLATIGPIATATASITDSLITDGRVASVLTHEVVDAAAIAAGAVGASEIAAGAVAASELASDAVTTAKILDANVTEAKLATDVLSSAWTNLTYGSGYTTPTPEQRFVYKKVGNIVYLSGGTLRSGSTSGTSTVIGTLPSGYRPSGNIVHPATTGSAAVADFYITTAGEVTLATVTTGQEYFANLAFPEA